MKIIDANVCLGSDFVKHPVVNHEDFIVMENAYGPMIRVDSPKAKDYQFLTVMNVTSNLGVGSKLVLFDAIFKAKYFKTCVCGAVGEETFEYGEPNGHDWRDAICYAPKTCFVCRITEGEPLGHDWVAATCTTPQTSTRCPMVG